MKNKYLLRIVIGVALLICGLLYKNLVAGFNEYIYYGIYIVSYIISGYDVLYKAVKKIFSADIFNENFLMSIATIGAFFIGEYEEAVAVMLFYQLGEYFQQKAVESSRSSITDLMNLRADTANVIINAQTVQTDPENVKTGDIILIAPGEKIPLDAIITKGTTYIDTSAITGESVQRYASCGSEILSGCINVTGLIEAEVTKEFSESTASKILELIENASDKKSKSEAFITKFARYYTPIVVFCAVFIAVIPTVFFKMDFNIWLYRALSFLVVSCPCALVISVPLSFFSGIGAAAKNGILVKGSNYLEALSKTEIVAFDKTGTLTKGVFTVQDICAFNGFEKEDLLYYAAYSENYSSHPIASSIKKAYSKDIDEKHIQTIQEKAGYGISAVIDNKEILIGNRKLMETNDISYKQSPSPLTNVYIAVNGTFAGYLTIADEIKSDAKQAITSLKQIGIKKTVLVSGDNKKIADYIGGILGIDMIYSDLFPIDKVEKIEDLLKLKTPGSVLAFVGDGINDAPVLARADIGISMGGLGSDAAIEASDIVILTDEPSKIASAIAISKKTIKIANQNVYGAIVIKVAILVLCALGIASMWAAVFADVGVALLAILNSLRAMKLNK